MKYFRKSFVDCFLFLVFFLGASFYAKGVEPQYVMITFDGARNLNMWKATHELSQQYDVRFTYFVSGVYFLNDNVKNLYQPPGKRPGRSAIGFGRSLDEVGQRVEAVYRAMYHGHEISSHANGHYKGGLLHWRGVTEGLDWDYSQWGQEFGDFLGFLWNVYENQPLQSRVKKNHWHQLLQDQVHGFRAPNLSVNLAMHSALSNTYQEGSFSQNFSYDSSRAKTLTHPYRKAEGHWDLPLGLIPIDGSSKKTIAMDYNFYVYDSKGKPDPANARKYRQRYYRSLKNYFYDQYNGERGPVIIGNHFATWNNGAYYLGLVDFIKEFCVMPDVECVTMADYVEILEQKEGVPVTFSLEKNGVPPW